MNDTCKQSANTNRIRHSFIPHLTILL